MRKSLNGILIVILGLLSSCTSYKSLLNYNNAPGIPATPQVIANYEPLKIQVYDILRIRISSTDEIALKPFTPGGGGEEGGASAYQELLVDSKGNIILPTIGAITVEGLNAEEAGERILAQLKPYFNNDPIVEVRLANFRINVNGEVTSPGTFSVGNERLTIIEALTLAGDFTDYSMRDSILVIREADGMRTFGYVDFHSPNIFDSEYFYLQQNDVVYVRPDKTKINTLRDPANRFLPWVSGIVSLTALIITITR